MLKRNSKGFSLIELIVTIAIIGILVMLASPKFLGRTKEATLAKHLYNVKTLEDTMDRYFLENDRFPRLSEEAYTSAEVEEYANRIRDLTGEEITLDPEGKYYDIDYVTLKDYVKVPDKRDMPNYILQNPVGKVFFLEELTELASDRSDFTVSNPKNQDSNNPIINKMPQEEIDEWVNKGYITISTAQELQSINNNLSGNYIQVNDINLSSLNFEPIGSNSTNDNTSRFSGIYNGNDFKITNLRIDKNTNYIGLFGYIYDSALIESVNLVNINIDGNRYVGGLVGYADSSIVTNSSSLGAVSGGWHIGGLVGKSDNDSVISNSFSIVTIKGTVDVGGLVGESDNKSIISNSFSKGTVSGQNSTGGLLGKNINSSSVNKSYSTATVNGGSYSGGLVGHNSGKTTKVFMSYASGAITGHNYTGGLVGMNNGSDVQSSYSTGAINGSGKNTGGLVGYHTSNGIILNSYSTGTVTGLDGVGGLSGGFLSGTIEYSFSKGKVEGEINTGGLVGDINHGFAVVKNSYYDKDTSTKTDSDKGIGKPTKEMLKSSTYRGWGSSIWNISNEKYPTLKWQTE